MSRLSNTVVSTTAAAANKAVRSIDSPHHGGS